MGRGNAEFGRGLTDGLEAKFREAEAQAKRVGSALSLGIQRGTEEARADADRLDARLKRVASGLALAFQRQSEQIIASQRSAARETESVWARSARAISGHFRTTLGGLGRTIGSTGTGIGSSLSGLLTGGFGGVLRSAGGAFSSITQGAFNVGGGLLSAGGTGVGALLGGGIGALAGPGGAALGAKIGGNVLGGLASVFQGGLQAAGGILGGVAQLAGNLGGAFVDKFVGVVKVGIAAAIGGAIYSAVRAAKGEELREAFGRITKGLGEDAEVSLSKFRAAVRGTVDDLTLIQQFNQAYQLGAVRTVNEFSQLATAAASLGKAVGRGAVDSINDLVVGLGRASPRILDNLGIIVSTRDAYDRYATSIGKSVDELTQAERRAAFQAEALLEIDRAARRVSSGTRSAMDELRTFGAVFGNLSEQVGQIFLPVLKSMAPEVLRIANNFSKWLSENKSDLANRLSTALQGVLGKVREIADFVEKDGLGTAFSALADKAKPIWEQFKTESEVAFASVRGRVDELFAHIQGKAGELASKTWFVRLLPGIGSPEDEARNTERLVANTRAQTEGAIDDIRRRRARETGDMAELLRLATRGFPARSQPVPVVIMNGAPPEGTLAANGGGTAGLLIAAQRLGQGLLTGALQGATGGPEGIFRGTVTAQQAIGGFTDATARGVRNVPDLPIAPESRGLPATISNRMQEFGEKLGASQEAIDEWIASMAGLVLRNRELAKDEINAARLLMDERMEEIARERDVSRGIRSNVEERARLEADAKAAAEEAAGIMRGIAAIERENAERTKRLADIARREIEIREDLRRSLVETTLRAFEAIKRATDGFTQQFRSALSGAASDVALPRNIRRGFEKFDRAEDRRVRRELQERFSSISSNEIASSPLLRAEIEGTIVATRIRERRPLEEARDRVADRKGPEAFAPEIEKARAEILAELVKTRAELDKTATAAIEALKEEEKAIKSALDATIETMKRQTEIAVSLADVARKHEEKIKELDKTIKGTEEFIRTFSNAGARR